MGPSGISFGSLLLIALVAFLLFLIYCTPILTRRRVDGRRG